MMRKTIHMCLDVRGVLTNWPARKLKGMFQIKRDGEPFYRTTTAAETKQILFDELQAGHAVIPLGKACEGFDYAGTGCPGHPEPEEAKA